MVCEGPIGIITVGRSPVNFSANAPIRLNIATKSSVLVGWLIDVVVISIFRTERESRRKPGRLLGLNRGQACSVSTFIGIESVR